MWKPWRQVPFRVRSWPWGQEVVVLPLPAGFAGVGPLLLRGVGSGLQAACQAQDLRIAGHVAPAMGEELGEGPGGIPLKPAAPVGVKLLEFLAGA